MSQNIINEVVFLLHSFLLGIAITFVYDGFLILRRLIRHSLFLISVEDLIFWIACAIGVFYMLYEENNGILRWFAVFGATLGMIVYKKSFSRLIVDFLSALIARIFRMLFGMIRFLLKPFRFLCRKVGRALRFSSKKGRKAGKCVKNKLTDRMKLLKITLCKH
ncbi:MAG: spore cortex biosynthesis protein YabQ [Lachnospiraceae bacterium]|nr:spore cortex biosynthesis protein YabQ [Lachnospiraceae bacterium]MDE6185118.1 spore cortex biosynthesis protein YabQ [Lachnospiraceae bacterium]